MVEATTQKVVALSSSEAEYYGVCRMATLGEFMRGVAEFWTGAIKPLTLKVDSSAAKAMSERCGVGRTRHAQARYLWLQMRVCERLLVVDKVKGTINDADLVTKVQPGVLSGITWLGLATKGSRFRVMSQEVTPLLASRGCRFVADSKAIWLENRSPLQAMSADLVQGVRW